MTKLWIIKAGNQKRYFQLRLCWMCDEQKMVNIEGICKQCTESKKPKKENK